jgi:hypothetical protein
MVSKNMSEIDYIVRNVMTDIYNINTTNATTEMNCMVSDNIFEKNYIVSNVMALHIAFSANQKLINDIRLFEHNKFVCVFVKIK